MEDCSNSETLQQSQIPWEDETYARVVVIVFSVTKTPIQFCVNEHSLRWILLASADHVDCFVRVEATKQKRSAREVK
jgi:hypothetical protein